MRATTRGVDLNALRSLLGFLVLTSGVANATVPDWEAPEGRFGFRLMVEGEVVEGQFDRFVVVPHVDTSGLPLGFDVEIDLRRVTTGNVDRDAELQAQAWFDTAAHPTARFSAERVETAPQAGFVTHGLLTLKGIDRMVAVGFRWAVSAAERTLAGETTLDRR
jgi:polyisoprenoid-binding protein YceI